MIGFDVYFDLKDIAGVESKEIKLPDIVLGKSIFVINESNGSIFVRKAERSTNLNEFCVLMGEMIRFSLGNIDNLKVRSDKEGCNFRIMDEELYYKEEEDRLMKEREEKVKCINPILVVDGGR